MKIHRLALFTVPVRLAQAQREYVAYREGHQSLSFFLYNASSHGLTDCFLYSINR